MSEQLYRVIKSEWVAGERKEVDIGSAWKPLKAANVERKCLALKHTNNTYSLQKQAQK